METSRAGSAGGALGLGLSHNIRDAYAFVCNNYMAGDEIFLFGFSRGAYTARSIGGLIGYAGLLGKQDLDRFFELWDGYKEPDKDDRAAALNKFPARSSVSIKVIGVWDTVGSLGIPSRSGALRYPQFPPLLRLPRHQPRGSCRARVSRAGAR